MIEHIIVAVLLLTVIGLYLYLEYVKRQRFHFVGLSIERFEEIKRWIRFDENMIKEHVQVVQKKDADFRELTRDNTLLGVCLTQAEQERDDALRNLELVLNAQTAPQTFAEASESTLPTVNIN